MEVRCERLKRYLIGNLIRGKGAGRSEGNRIAEVRRRRSRVGQVDSHGLMRFGGGGGRRVRSGSLRDRRRLIARTGWSDGRMLRVRRSGVSEVD